MVIFLRGALILLSIYLLVSVIYMIWAIDKRPDIINEKGEYKFYSYDFSDIKYLTSKVLLFGATFGFMVIIGMGAYELLYWVPYLSEPDNNGDWNHIRKILAFLIGLLVGITVHSKLSLYAFYKRLK